MLLSFFFINILVLIAIIIYNKITTGVCKSSAHLVGKVVIVTGANRGIGFEVAKDLAERGAKVILACRNESSAIAACQRITELTGNINVHYKHLDLSSLKSVREFVVDIEATEKRLDILINNAGANNLGKDKTEDGLLIGMQINFFGAFLLTNLLLPLLKSSAPSRIINVSSYVYTHGKIDVEDLNLQNMSESKFDAHQVFANSKLCNVITTVELNRKLEGTGVTVNCLHPGVVDTDDSKNCTGVLKYSQKLIGLLFKSPWEGAQTYIYLAVSPEVKDASGKYFTDCRERNIWRVAENSDLAKKLWQKSEELVKLK